MAWVLAYNAGTITSSRGSVKLNPHDCGWEYEVVKCISRCQCLIVVQCSINKFIISKSYMYAT